jgi:hypothetical protein
MEPVIIRNSRRWPLAVLSAGAAGLSVAALFHGNGSPLFAIELVSALLCGVLAAWLLLDRRPQVVLDDRGILDRRLRIGLIPWSRIDRAYAQPLGGLEMVWVEMRRDASGAPGSERVPLRVTGLGITAEQLLGLIARGTAAWRPSEHGI